MVRTKQVARKAGGKENTLSTKKTASKTFAGICKRGGSCVKHDGHGGPCKDGDMDEEGYDVEAIIDERHCAGGMEVSCAF